MRLDLEVLALSEDVLRDLAYDADTEDLGEEMVNLADRLADLVDRLDPDHG